MICSVKRIALFALMLLLGGCFSRSYQQRRPDLFSQVKIGMTKQEVQRLFPKMYPLRQRALPNGGRLEAYRIQKIGWGLFIIPMPVRGDEIDFVFEDDRLMEWGETPKIPPILTPESVPATSAN